MSVTAHSRYGVADACIALLLANAMLTRQYLKAMFFHETYRLLRMKSLSHFARRTGTAALSARKDANAGCIGNGLWISKFQRGRAIATIRAKYPSTNTPPRRNFHHFLVRVVWLKSAVRQAKMRMRCPIAARGTIIVSTCRT